jgi:hypothetical protein
LSLPSASIGYLQPFACGSSSTAALALSLRLSLSIFSLPAARSSSECALRSDNTCPSWPQRKHLVFLCLASHARWAADPLPLLRAAPPMMVSPSPSLSAGRNCPVADLGCTTAASGTRRCPSTWAICWSSDMAKSISSRMCSGPGRPGIRARSRWRLVLML